MTNLALFNLSNDAITAPVTSTTLKDIREGLTAEFEADNAPTWAKFNAAFAARNWAVTPSKALAVAAFGKERGGKVWTDIEARWCLLQAASAVYVEEINDTTVGAVTRADINKKRKSALFKMTREILAYHGISLQRDLKPADLLTLGELAIKYAFVSASGEAEARAVGTAAYIKAAIYALLGRDGTKVALDGLCKKAVERAEKARENADSRLDWNEGARPKFLLG